MNKDLAALRDREPLAVGGGALWPAEAADLLGKLEQLRAIVVPLLEDPVRDLACVFCRAQSWSSERPEILEHRPECPVLRRDELLGGRA